MRKLIDTNEQLLVKDLIEHHQDRISSEHKLLTNFSGCDIVDVLCRFYSYYGDAGAISSRKTKAAGATLGGSWDRSNTTTHRRFSPPSLMYYFSRLQRARNLHDRHHQLERVMALLTAHIVFTQSALDALRNKLDSTTPCDDRATYPEIPSIVHTTRALTFRGMYQEIPGDYSSQDAVFHKLLGLPLLDADKTLAFCSHKFETFVLFAKVASGPSTLLQQAGVLEDIYVW
jgi:hypothetical protein